MALQLRKFAETVLYGTTIEEKLSFPREKIIDSAPGSAIQTPQTLARPSHLKLKRKGTGAKHPSEAKLINEAERGRLLHFFANHELLATELMALVLLKFPDAPSSFRQGVLETLKEEQIHTQLYIHRMEQCGIVFGELPLSDYFWRSVSSMNDPLDYVTRLSLTFEQANLDYSRDYSRIFNTVGDTDTAKILDKIYRDEIEHVGFGLRWFRQWKANGKSDWNAYQENLTFPLSPARAKGPFFNRKGRTQIGFDSNFIEKLEVFNQSKGRTPNVYWFNPNAESNALLGSSKPKKKQSHLEADLDLLPAYLSKQDDILLVHKVPSDKYLKMLRDSGFLLPEIQTINSFKKQKIGRKINRLCPWAWTPESIDFSNTITSSKTNSHIKTSQWSDKFRALYSKNWSAQWARKWTIGRSDSWLAPIETYGSVIKNLQELTTHREKLASLGYMNIVCKAQFATAANGNRCILNEETISPSIDNWLTKMWAEQIEIIVEPWLNRVFDFSVQLEMQQDSLRVKGFTRLKNNKRGQFQGIITNGFCKSLPPQLVRFLMEKINGRPRVYQLFEHEILPELENALQTIGFEGPIGIDSMIYEDSKGELRIKPIIEINPRNTMGSIALELEKHNASGRVGLFQIVTKSQLRGTKIPNLGTLASQLNELHPLQLTNEPQARIIQSSIPLVDPCSATQFLALYHVRKSIAELPCEF